MSDSPRGGKSEIGKRLVIVLGVLLTVVAAPVALLVMNQYVNTEATSATLTADVQSYATEWGIDPDEAVRRLALQDTIGELAAALERNEDDTFAGLWIKHGTNSEDFGAVVRFTRHGDQILESYSNYVKDGPLSGMVEIRTASKTLKALRDLRRNVTMDLRGLEVPIESGINIEENRAEIYVAQRNRLDAAMSNSNITLPDSVEIITIPELSRTTAEIYGGLTPIPKCTLGFSVEHNTNILGVTTAGHCPNNLSHNGSYLPFKGEMSNYNRDVQWHSAPGFTVVNKIVDGITGDTHSRHITATRDTSLQTKGTFVCKYGKTTKYGCGYITDAEYLPDNDMHECEPDPDCDFADTWILLESNTEELARGGDSGGPVFRGASAYGTIAFRHGNGGAIYMPIDYISQEGLSVLTD